jgi:hypothetical protein
MDTDHLAGTDDIFAAVDHDAELARHVTESHEVEAIRQLEAQLRDEFPSLPEATVDQVVAARYHELDASRIRDYVPVLVEHAAKADLLAMRR